MTIFPIPDVALGQHTIALGKTRSGKSSALRLIAERMLDAGKPVGVIDPKGDWWGLRSNAAGTGAGYPVVIFGGEHADVPIDPRAGAAVAELVATGNRPFIIDLGGWMVGERTRFFITFASTLFRHMRGPRVLIVDECHNFAPQGKILDPDAGKMLHWANRLASEGAGKGLTLLSASQRPQKVHKDYLTCHETLIAMRVVHPLDRRAVKDWVDGCDDPAKGAEVIGSLASMRRGQAWVWSPEAEYGPVKIQFPMFRTYDSFKAPTADAAAGPLKGWASVDLDEVRAKLGAIVEEAAANDPKALKARVAELERQARGAVKVGIDPNALAQAETAAFERGRAEGVKIGYAEGVDKGRAQAASFIRSGFDALASTLDHMPEAPLPLTNAEAEALIKTKPAHAAESRQIPSKSAVAPPVVRQIPTEKYAHRPTTTDGDLGPAASKLLTAIVRQRMPLTWAEICTLAGLVPGNGYFYGGRKELLTRGLIREEGDRVEPTTSGLASRPSWPQPMQPGEIVELWRAKLGAPAPDMLATLFAEQGAPLSVEALAQRIRLRPGNGYWYRGIKLLRDAGLVTQGGSGGALELTEIVRG